jgi:predicted molibdopterin-dependent oxidoreductase YjgC
MSAVSSVCCYCGTGCGVPIEVGAGKITGVRGDPARPASCAAARTCVGGMCGRFMTGMHRVLNTLAKGLTASRQGAA